MQTAKLSGSNVLEEVLPACFIPFQSAIENCDLPAEFNDPFDYEAHALSVRAAEEIQAYLQTQREWEHDFGDAEHPGTGKMFGVLVVRHKSGQIGYLAAFSGKVADSNHLYKFVPPVYDMLEEGSFFMVGQEKLNQLNAHVKLLEADEDRKAFLKHFKAEQARFKKETNERKQAMLQAKSARKLQRKALNSEAPGPSRDEAIRQLDWESGHQRGEFKRFVQSITLQKAELEQERKELFGEIDALKEERANLSNHLQSRLYDSYRFLNGYGVSKDLRDIFLDFGQTKPVAGAGECAAPKLLHYAYQNHLQPITMAEFWWGASPKGGERIHTNFYPACEAKCRPVLGHMLKGLRD